MDINKINKVEVLESIRAKVKQECNRIPPDLKMADLKAKRGNLSLLAFVSMLAKYGDGLYSVEVKRA